MKKFLFILAISTVVVSCKNDSNQNNTNIEVADVSEFESFGAKISAEGAISTAEMMKKYETLSVGDSLEVTFNGTVKSICQKKGCWMTLDMGKPEHESFVKFKDYGFFVPMDAEGADAILKGIAKKEETSVEELKHYAQDAGKSEEEIAKITEPKVEYTFMAEGVLLKKKG